MPAPPWALASSIRFLRPPHLARLGPGTFRTGSPTTLQPPHGPCLALSVPEVERARRGVRRCIAGLRSAIAEEPARGARSAQGIARGTLATKADGSSGPRGVSNLPGPTLIQDQGRTTPFGALRRLSPSTGSALWQLSPPSRSPPLPHRRRRGTGSAPPPQPPRRGAHPRTGCTPPPRRVRTPRSPRARR
jgi:hypothetical protein